MNTLSLSTSSESSQKLNAMFNAIASACDALCDILGTMAVSFENISTYSIQSVQGVYNGVKSLFVDVIITGLKKIEVMIRELQHMGSDSGYSTDHIQSLILLQKSQLENRLSSHIFFRENFARRVNEIFH